MANTADKFKEEVMKIADEGLRNVLLENFNLVNRERGEFGQKLIEKDAELGTLRTEKQTYSKAVEVLKKTGVSAEEIPKILEKLQISKTEKEEYELTKVAAHELQKAVEKKDKEIHRFRAEKVLNEKFEKARSEFKDDKGNVIKLTSKVIDYDKLYDVQDLTNETVLNEKIVSVLKDAAAKQTEFLRDLGHVGIQVHTTPGGVQSPAAGTADLKQIGEIMKAQGPEAAIAADRARREKQRG